MVPSPAKLLQHQAEARGFLAAFAPIGLPAETQLRYRAFIENGNHAGMRYLEKNLEERLDPRRRFPWAKSVLVLAAAHDMIARPEYGRALAAAIPGSAFVEIGGAGHAVTIQCAGEVNRLLLGHLEPGSPSAAVG